ncbi:MBL fold metallo-hydrolase [Luteolibacter ambystomatis]|uniref:MBL fold metallo-hydrolase n=1 Tax=Luteolibacter ambystomatis TaxID=2824561 RepID=A0A975IZL4_9BACT|nr:MBL fold metallo-hydrolase [Luteolibacter ambystomatis]QUE51058.1 MBL fold metallo-hydrolase [Luteolibacter ambystomatis]
MIFKSLCRHAGIGANSYLLEASGARVVLDSGMHPELEGPEACPRFELLEPGSVDATIITHSHLDHVGTMPVLLEQQPQSKVFLTPETADLACAMLHNSVNVMQAKRIELGINEYPLFEHREIDVIAEKFELRGIERPFDVDPDGKIRATFHDAGHILGSVGVTLKADGKTLLYTGDVNFEDATIQKGAILPHGPVDALVIETTRGDYARRPDYTRLSEENALGEAISRVIARKGSVLLPVFAMGKTQEVLAMIHRFKQENLIPYKTPVYIGGLSTKMTLIYDRHSDTSRRKLPGFRILADMDLEAGNRDRRKPRQIPLVQGAIYALSSGMMTEKTVSNLFARTGILENKKNGLFFVGYADPSSPGGKIRAATQGDLVTIDAAHGAVPINCDVKVFDFSGHATREALLDYIIKVNPPKTFLVHGDEPAVEWFKQQLAEKLPGTQVIVPQPGEEHVI